MHFHETPSEVAELLARHVPRSVKTVLDPAVGHGALLLPIVSRVSPDVSVVCVDVDPDAIVIARQNLSASVKRLHCVNGDFLEAVLTSNHLKARKFDCVVMNPPYAARKAEWVECDCTSLGRCSRMWLPKELAFVFRAVERLRDGGRLLAVMPGSMVSSTVLTKFRDCLGTVGRFHYVHELPKFTFPGVEGRVYLVVYEKGGIGSQIELRNHDLLQPHRLCVSWDDLGNARRLDFGFHHSRHWISRLVEANKNLGWTPLNNLVAIRRGPRKSPRGPRVALHTTDWDCGVWRVDERHLTAAVRSCIEPNDLFVARVGRACLSTIGPVDGFRQISWSDCVFRLRPVYVDRFLSLLLSIRVVAGMPAVCRMIERGVGATYITESELGEVLVPTRVQEMFPRWSTSYATAWAKGNLAQMEKIEAHIRRSVIRSVGPIE